MSEVNLQVVGVAGLAIFIFYVAEVVYDLVVRRRKDHVAGA
jgi:hypothetical protein